jgi:class II lanthipeptide synthase
MTPHAFDAGWYRALTLRERGTLLGDGSLRPTTDAHALRAAEERRAAWVAQPPFDREPWLRERLAADGLDEPTFLAILAATPEELARAMADPPAWLVELHQAYAADSADGSDATSEPPADEAIPYPEWVGRDATGRFLELFEPLVQRGRRRLAEGLARLSLPARSAADLERMLVAALPMWLATMLERTAVLELHVARHQGWLAGETPEQRFESFVERLRRPDVAQTLLVEYPVLARAAAEHVQAWVEGSLELMGRLAHDWDELRATLLERSDPGELVDLRLEAGDAHRGGRSVAILEFSSGVKLVYKPRSLGMEARFQEVLGWLNQRGAEPGFRTLGVIDRGEYGWVEFAMEAPCASEAEVERYFRRMGGLLAILHATGAMDFHFQNLVASGEHPIAVDLESLFHPLLPSAPVSRADERLAARALGDSVLRVGMLPFRVSDAEGDGPPDWSGVASVAGQRSPDPVLDWERAGTDEMHAVKRHLPMKGGRNRPTLEGREAEAADHIEPIARGFERTYRLLLEHRDAFAEAGGPLERLAETGTRVVLRTTRGYGMLLDESWHPDLLRDALDRDRFLDRLWVGADEMPAWRRAAVHDHRQLWRGDIPWFGAQPDSRDLWSGGGERLPDFVAESGLDWVRRRLADMGEDDLLCQAWLTRVSLGTLLLNSDRGEWPDFPLTDPGTPQGPALRERLCEQARTLGEWFERVAFQDGADSIWIALDHRQGAWSLYPCSEDLYAGAPGIAHFLGALGARTGEAGFTALARAGMGTLLQKLEAAPDQVPFIGLYQGWGSTVYALAHLGALTGEGAWLDAAERLIPRILERLERDRLLDVVGGAAGAAAALLALDRVSGSAPARAAAVRCGEHLLAAARMADGVASWRTELGGEEPLTGFAHGASGIAAALADLAATTGDPRYLDAAIAGLTFERGALRGELRMGRSEGDLAHARFDPGLALTWCYGAPGMGLARLRALRAIDTAGSSSRPVERESLHEDLDETLALTLERGFGKNHCLCHGDLGNLDFLIEAERWRPSEALRARIEALTRAVLASLVGDGWRCGTVAGIEAPGLMNGLAGIGYGLLRLAEPEHVPSVLAMEAPRTASPAPTSVTA